MNRYPTPDFHFFVSLCTSAHVYSPTPCGSEQAWCTELLSSAPWSESGRKPYSYTMAQLSSPKHLGRKTRGIDDRYGCHPCGQVIITVYKPIQTTLTHAIFLQLGSDLTRTSVPLITLYAFIQGG